MKKILNVLENCGLFIARGLIGHFFFGMMPRKKKPALAMSGFNLSKAREHFPGGKNHVAVGEDVTRKIVEEQQAMAAAFMSKQAPAIGSDDLVNNDTLVNEKKEIIEAVEILEEALTNKSDPALANSICAWVIRIAIGANDLHALQSIFLDGKATVKDSMSRENVDLLTNYYIEQGRNEAEKSSVLGVGASVAIMDKMVYAWFKKGWHKDANKMAAYASAECRAKLVENFIKEAKNDKVVYEDILESVKIRGVRLSTEEINSLVTSLLNGLRYNDAEKAIHLGADEGARSILAAAYIEKQMLDEALAVAKLGVNERVKDALCTKFMKKDFVDKAITIAHLGVSRKVIDELRVICSRKGMFDRLRTVAAIVGEGLNENELKQIAQSWINNGTHRNQRTQPTAAN